MGLSSFMEARTTVVWLRHLRAASSVVRFGLSGASFAVPCDLYDVPDGAPCRSSRRTVLKRVTVLGRLTVLGPQHPMR